MLHRALGQLSELAEAQHGVISRAQLLHVGCGRDAVKHGIATGRLHPVRRGVYAVGRPQLTTRGRWIAAVLCCGPDAVLSHASAAALWKIGNEGGDEIEVSVPAHVLRRRPGLVVHRRATLSADEVVIHERIPVTSPATTLIDLAMRLPRGRLEAAINEADKRGLLTPEELKAATDTLPRRPGIATARDVLDRRTFALTESDLERRFLRIVRTAGLPRPRTQCEVNGFRVDFHWPDVGLVVETDGLRYHRTPAQQARDRLRDQAHAAAGLTCLRFTHAQVGYEPGYVKATLVRVHWRLRRIHPTR